MEHVLHIFGGGCGEHMIWAWLIPILSSGAGLGIFRKHKKAAN